MPECPECNGRLDEDELKEGETLFCPKCGAELEVISENPADLRLAEGAEELEDEDDDEFEDEEDNDSLDDEDENEGFH